MILVNGNFIDTLPVMDRGLSYGDGLFETIAVRQSRPLLWDLHWSRFCAGCDRLRIECPDEALVLDEIQRLVARADTGQQERCVIKLMLTRGAGGRGYLPEPDMRANRILILNDWPQYPGDYYLDGVDCRICDTRLCSQPILAGIKHLNRLEQVLARMEWSDQAIAEGIMLDDRDHVIEGTMSNVFFVTGAGGIETPALEYCGVQGVQRENIINIAASRDIPLKQLDIEIDSLDSYSEAFLTNSLIGIWPVRKLGRFCFEPGTLTRELQKVVNS